MAMKWATTAEGARIRVFDFHPGEVLEYTIGWDRRLAEDDQLVGTPRFEINTTDLEFFSPTITSGHRAQVWARGNPPIGAVYTAVSEVSTVKGRRLRQAFRINVTEPW